MDMIDEADKLAAAMTSNFDEMTKINLGNKQLILSMRQSFGRYYTLAKSVSAGMVEGTLLIEQMQSKAGEMREALDQFQTLLSGFAQSIDANLMAIRDITTKTAEGAKQTHASSHELARVAGQRQGLVTRFRV